MSVAWKLLNYNNDGHRGWYSRELRLSARSVAVQPGTMADEERRYVMTHKKAAIQVLLLCAVVGLSGCAGKAPTGTLSQAELAVQQADKSKAPEYASLELYTAREQLSGAQQALHNKEYTQARRLAERALVNAELAETMAEAGQTQRAAQELRHSIEALRYEAEQQASRSR